MGFAVKVNAIAVVKAGDNLLKIDNASIGNASLRAVNEVAERSFDLAIKRMTERVNLTQDYVQKNMGIEAANDPGKPKATIIAFRSGGRRRVRPVNLRQYNPIFAIERNKYQNPSADGKRKRFTMKDGRQAMSPIGPNPRKPGARLPFILRTGNPLLGIPVGSKQGDVSVEVLKGARKVIRPSSAGFKPFLQRMPNGELLVMRRTSKNGGKGNKGKIEALYSLSTWQLFRNAARDMIPEVQEDLANTVAREIQVEVDEAFK